MMKAVLKLPGQAPTEVTLQRDQEMLPQLQMHVGGYVEVWPTQDSPWILLCNEEAALHELAENLDMADEDRVLSIPGALGVAGILRGPALFVGLTDSEGKFTSLSDAAILHAIRFADSNGIQ